MSEFISYAPKHCTSNDVNRSNPVCYDVNIYDYNNLQFHVLMNNFVYKCNTKSRAIDYVNNNELYPKILKNASYTTK